MKSLVLALLISGVNINGVNIDHDNSICDVTEISPTVCVYGRTVATNAVWWTFIYF